MIVVRDREAGNVIEIVESIKKGQELIEKYEEMDKRAGLYTPNFYEVAEAEDSEVERWQ